MPQGRISRDAVIVDRAGNVVAQLRDNGAGQQTPAAARRKAFTPPGRVAIRRLSA
jgi:uncharacterized protein GlcG (DUF336 family)